MGPIITLLCILAILVGIVFLFVFMMYFGIWMQAKASGAGVSLFSLMGMFFRKVNSMLIVRCYIKLHKAGLSNVVIDELESHAMAGGNVENVVDALIAANKANIQLSFKQASAIDLAGRNVLEAVRMSVNPKVIDCPDQSQGRKTIDAVSKDGIQVKAKVRVTVRANLDRLVGGATEETIVARVGEGIVTTIGSSETYTAVLENPDSISNTVLKKSLDSGTAFEILSIDIADVDVGENIGSRLQADQAQADMRVAEAKAEMRRAAAVAAEQEMRAKVQEMQAKVIEAQAQVPLAMAQALQTGKLGVMDYYRLENLKADTEMRQKLVDPMQGVEADGAAPKKPAPPTTPSQG